MRARATVGEVSLVLENVFGRHRAHVQTIQGVYSGNYGDGENVSNIKQRIEAFHQKQGRRPRLLVAKLGQDGHDRGAKVVATAFADLGFDVDVGPLFSTPEEAARHAVESDVHVIGVSTLAAGHRTLIPQLIHELGNNGGGNILVVCGGVIPPQDYEDLKEAGVSAIFAPGTPIPDSASELLDVLEQQ